MPDIMSTLFISIDTPVPTTARIGFSDGKLRLEFEVDLAAEIGRAVLSNRMPDVSGIVRGAILAASQELFRSAHVARQPPQGTA